MPFSEVGVGDLGLAPDLTTWIYMLWAELCLPPNSYVDGITPIPQDVPLFRNRVTADISDEVTLEQGTSLIQYGWFPYEEGNLDTDRTPCKDEGRDQGDASTSRGLQRLPANRKLRERET